MMNSKTWKFVVDLPICIMPQNVIFNHFVINLYHVVIVIIPCVSLSVFYDISILLGISTTHITLLYVILSIEIIVIIPTTCDITTNCDALITNKV